MPLPDLSSALQSFQRALDAREIRLQKGTLDPELFMHLDSPNGESRMTYVRVEKRRVTSMVQLIHAEPYEGETCFAVGWAVPEDLRGQGRAGQTFLAAVKEVRHGFTPHGLTAFWVEAVVGVDNTASQRVAERVISAPVKTSVDAVAGAPIIQYLRRIDALTVL